MPNVDDVVTTDPEKDEDKKADDALVEGPVEELAKGAVVAPVSGRWQRLKDWVLGTTWGRVTGVVAVVVVALGIILGTNLRYPVVGLFYKNTADIKVIDSVTHQPLTNATVSLAGQQTTSDMHGVAHLEGLSLGRSTLTVIKKAYKPVSRSVLVPVGRPKFDPVALESAGIALTFNVTDKISGKALDDVVVSVGDTEAVSKDGKLRLVLLPSVGATASAKVSKDGFVDATVKVEVKSGAKPYDVALVPSGKVYFLSNRSGRIDLYSSNLDGSETQIALAGTGKEDEQTGILPNIKHPNLLAIISSREGRRDNYGTLVHDLFVFNADTGKLSKVDDGIGFTNYRAWLGDYLVYQKANDNNCSSVKAYSTATASSATVVASGNGCATINAVYDDTVLYSITGGDTNANGLYAMKADGGSKRRLSETPGSQVARKAKETILLEYYNYSLPKPDVWQSLNLGNLAVTKVDAGPSTVSYRAYNESLSEKYAAFIEERDGKSELYVTDSSGGNERKLTSMGSVNQFVQWYGDDYLIFSSTKSDENALYVVAASGGQPQKVADFYRGNARTYGGGYNPQY